MIWVSLMGAAVTGPAPVEVKARVMTEAVPGDADDPALWVNPREAARSLVVGTDKASPAGGLYVFGLDGKVRQRVTPLDRPNNVDIEYGIAPGVDIAATTERGKQRLRVFRVDESGLTDISPPETVKVFAGETGQRSLAMGISLYKRAKDGAVFAVVSRKSGASGSYLWQYRLRIGPDGKAAMEKVREFGQFSGGEGNEVEAVAVDDTLGYVYYADEAGGIRKYHADPDHPEAAKELAYFGRDGFGANREGIGIYARRDGTGYLVCTDQLAGSSQYRIFRREGAKGNPHDHSEVLKVVAGGADSTDGLDVSSANLGPAFPNGIVMAMNSQGKNFLFYRWDDFARTGSPRLRVGR